MKINDCLHGFRLLRRERIEEADSMVYEFFHEKSGARLLFLENKDDNKVFSISFRTPPADDTGVAHIVEHSTLCGSRKFPLKEPFVELVKGSLNTFLNAMTYPDKTMYPVASRNAKDFQNLMDVYLDAVFYPAMYQNPQVLMQEGWHYEIDAPEEPLRYSGVVYNEMKGALSSPEDLLENKMMASLYPDTTYGYESGGNPKAIPSLTQEMFINFHRQYYHPSNSYIYLYGDLDIEEKLAFLDSEYLSHFDRIPVLSKITVQKPFAAMHRQVEEYPIGAEESTAEKTFLSLNYLMGRADDAKTMLALEILEQALLKSQAAPLRKALLDAKIGKDVYASFADALQQPFFSIVVNGAEPDRAEHFYEIVKNTLQKLVDEGLDHVLLEASLNALEFKLREADFGQYPKGLIYNIKIMNSWLYDGDAMLFLHYEDLLKEVRAGLSTGYFESVIRQYFLENTHKTLLTLQPSTTLAAAQEAEQEKALAEKKAALSPEALNEIMATTAQLKKRQQEKDTPEALATIPLLHLSDIQRTFEPLPLEERSWETAKILFHDVKTQDIAYLTLFFDASRIPQQLLPYAFLLTELLGAVDTKNHTYAELANCINLSTGGISYDLTAYTKKGAPDSCLPKFKVRAKALVRKLPALFDLLAEILTGSSFIDGKRLEELLLQSRASMEMDLLRASHQVMMARLFSYLSPAGKYNEAGSLEFYWFVRSLTEDFSAALPKIQAAFAELIPILFNRKNLLVSITTAEKDYAVVTKNFATLWQTLSEKIFPPVVYRWDQNLKNEGLLAASQVQFVGKGANFLKLGYAFTGSMRVLETILRYGYLWTRVRVQGGAYGAFTQFNRNGNMFFGSYRDPNLEETLAVFDETADYLRKFQATDREMTKYIIGTISGVDTPLTPQMKGRAAADFWIRQISEADRQSLREEILTTQPKDIQKLAELVADCMKQNYFCVFGNEGKLKASVHIFDTLRNVLD